MTQWNNSNLPAYWRKALLIIYTMLTNVLPTINNETSYEQQIVHYNPSVNPPTTNNPQSYLYPQHVPNGQIVNQFSSDNLTAHHHQQQLSSSWINMTTADIQQPTMDSNNGFQQESTENIITSIPTIS